MSAGRTLPGKLSLLLPLGVVLSLAALAVPGIVPGRTNPPEAARSDASAQADPLAGVAPIFVENRGQLDPSIRYVSVATEPAIGFGDTGVRFSQQGRSVVGFDFAGASAGTTLEAGGRTPTRVSYLTNGDPLAGLRTYERVAYEEVWPGIDAVYRGATDSLKYRFEVAPGAEPAAIMLRIRGADSVSLNGSGQLEVGTRAGVLVDDAPLAYQIDGGRRIPVPAGYSLHGDLVGFDLGSHDRSLPLVVDPAVFVNAGYIGGDGAETLTSMAVAGGGDAVVSGTTFSLETSFPDGDGFDLLPGNDHTRNGLDAFVVRVNAAGTALEWATYFGGSASDDARDVALDSNENVYITGQTSSLVLNGIGSGFDNSLNAAPDGYVAKLGPTGTQVLYSGYIGGSSSNDVGWSIAVDASNRAYVAGETQATEDTFPDGTDTGSDGDAFDAIPAFDKTYNGGPSDGFFARVAADGLSLEHASYVGGDQLDVAQSIDFDSTGRAYVGGHTASMQTTFPDGDPGDSDTFPVATGFDQTFNGVIDGFVMRTDTAGTTLEYGTYLGGDQYDDVLALAVVGTSAYVGGEAISGEATFPDGTDTGDNDEAFDTIPGFDQTQNSSGTTADGWIGKLNQTGTGLDFATYIGGGAFDLVRSVAVDAAGRVWAVGFTFSDQITFPDGDGFNGVPGPDVTHNGPISGQDAFAVRLDALGTGLDYATFIGGNDTDEADAVGIGASGRVHVAGLTESSETTFPDGDGLSPLTGPDTTYNDDGSEFDSFLVTIGVTNPLSASTAGAGTGSVSSSPSGISCPGTCSDQFDEDSTVSLTATPAGGSFFSGWSGDCSGTGACQVTMDQAKAVTATFEAITAKSVGLSSNKAKVKKNKKAILTATVSPCAGHEGDTVDLLRNGATLMSATSDQACTAVFPVKMRRKATFQAVSSMQDADHSEGRSPEVTIKVKKPKRN